MLTAGEVLPAGGLMLTVHHLGKSQSERIVWLCEELELPYELKRYARDSVTMLAPPDYKALHPIGAAPVIVDGDLVLAESGAIVDYIMAKYGKGRLVLGPDAPDFAQFLYWFHFANGTLQAGMGRLMLLNRLKLAEDNPMLAATKARVDRAFDLVDARVRDAEYLAGSSFTTGDIMMGFSLTTMRYFQPYDLARCPNVVKYLGRIGARPAYQRAMEKGDPGMALLLS
jgi:glutathione S-transferase